MVVALSQGLGLTVHEVLYEYSFKNLVMLSSALPSPDYDSKKDSSLSHGEQEWDDAFDANNPDLAGRFE